MAVYVDELRTVGPSPAWHWVEACHLFADGEDELHAFARALGLRREWYQGEGRLAHYDLTARRRRSAVARGAVEVDREFVAAFIRRTQGGAR